jgi:YegS/Rv2252/BmrU family lipid kinase
MRIVLVINPISGPRRHRSVQAADALARDVLGRHGATVDVRVTTARGDARRFSEHARADGADLVIAWGGDGTINEVAGALAFSDVPLGIVPGGSGNGLARELGIALDPARALETIVTGRTHRIDAGQIDTALFFNVAGIGVDAVIAREIARPDARRGLSGYARITLVELPRYRPLSYRIVCDEDTIERRAVLLALANSRQYGNGALIAPAARLDDGRLDLVVVEAQPVWRMVRRMPELFRGTLSTSPGLLMRSFTRATIGSDAPIAYHADGEPGLGGVDVAVCTHPGALSVRVPKA